MTLHWTALQNIEDKVAFATIRTQEIPDLAGGKEGWIAAWPTLDLCSLRWRGMISSSGQASRSLLSLQHIPVTAGRPM